MEDRYFRHLLSIYEEKLDVLWDALVDIEEVRKLSFQDNEDWINGANFGAFVCFVKGLTEYEFAMSKIVVEQMKERGDEELNPNVFLRDSYELFYKEREPG